MSENFILKSLSPIDFISASALQATFAEASVFPKPGLVDPLDSGSHKDMNFFTFIKSATSLTNYFKICALKGFNAKKAEPALLVDLRKDGIEAEKRMFLFTNGVNTHKGAIFSIGLIAAAAGFCFRKDEKSTPERILNTVSYITKNIEKELNSLNAETAGKKIFKEYGITGIRGEAARGYPSIIKTALPAFDKYLSKGFDLNRTLAGTLIEIMSIADDTNIISRGGIDALKYVKKEAGKFISSEHIFQKEWKKHLETMNIDFKKRNLSPGGSADLLAATIFILILNGFEL